MSAEILNGTRRPKGHLLAQSIAQLDNSDYFLKNKVARIIRIAVHPKLTRNNFGSQLLQHIESSLSTQVKAIGASFGGYASLLSFWQNLNYRIIKVGFKKDKVSGEHACLVLKSLNSTSQIPIQELKQQLSHQLPLYLIHSFNTLNAALVVELLKYLLPSNIASLEHDLADIKRYLEAQHSLEQVVPNLWRVIWQNIPLIVMCNTFTQELIIRLILQNQSIEVIQKEMLIKGKKQLSSDIKTAISEFIGLLK